MNPERYQIIKRHFHAARELPEPERRAFLDQACGDDQEMLVEVEALIKAAEKPGDFLDAPAYELAAGLLIDPTTGELEGASLGPYRIISLLGAGGMGEVYLAEDSRLGRQVALKLLPDHLSDDPDRVRRFRQEARAASALNHPNLTSIYEIEQVNGRFFIAMEFVNGETLRRVITRGPVPPAEALRITEQIASALAEAHQIGIVHRDIKPENIMLDVRGRVKILDFGLAKYMRDPNPAGSTVDSYLTTPGLLMGTTAYMSPEQVRAFVVDARTDIWSLGAVLYEMLVGAPPFDGLTRSDVIAAILEREPAPISLSPSSATAKLGTIIGKMLAKDRRQRYSTATELVQDLESLRGELGSPADLSRAKAPRAADASRTVTNATQPGEQMSSSVRSVALVMLTGVLLAAVAFAGVKLWRKYYAAAVVTPSAATNIAPERQLGYWIEVQKYRDGKPFQTPFRLGKEIVFENDYQIRLHLRAAQDGQLYVFSEGPAANGQSASYVILFPSSTTNDGNSRLSAGGQLQIPAESWFAFDAKQGTEKLWLVHSATPIASLEALKVLANSRDRGLISDPGASEGLRSFLNSPKAPPPRVVVDEENKDVVLKYNGDTLIYLLRLEHH